QQEAGFTRTGNAARGMAGGVLEARAAVQGLNGNLTTLAAGRWLSQIQALQPILNGMFPVLGAIAFVGVLDQVVEKTQKWVSAHDPLHQAQTESLSILKKTGDEYDALKRKVTDLAHAE